MIYSKKITALICVSTAVLFLFSFAIVQLNAQSENKIISDQNSSVSLNQEIISNDIKEENIQENIEEEPEETEEENIQNTETPENNVKDENIVSTAVNPHLLEIPSIGVSALIEHLGLNSEGNMDMTSSVKNVAWYNLGPQPGEIGGAVIGGHYGYPGPAVFHNLEKLKKGDIVYVKGSNSETVKFLVRETRIYKADEIVSEIFFPEDGKAHLNLVTCNGTWVSSLKTYNQRLVVFTDMIL
jgi:LPXTG-site transpeptidase (sortase) family protein